MSNSILFPEQRNSYRVTEPSDGHPGATVEGLFAGGSIWANNPETLRAELNRRGLTAIEVDFGPTRGGTMFRLGRQNTARLPTAARRRTLP